MQLIDTHVHINFGVFQSDIQATCDRWRSAGVTRLIHSCVTPDEFASIQALAKRFPELYFAVGLHPLDAQEWQSDTQERIRSLAASDPKVVAIGEMGLDFYKAQNQDRQKLVFASQLQIAQELNKPVIIHCRDAALVMAQLLRDFWKNRGRCEG
jgi:TatD DNase family protein